MPNIVDRLTEFVQTAFKTTLEVFLAALKLSPNAQGYVLGSVSEIILKNTLEEAGYEVRRIREKWLGPKHRNHHGDFYFKKRGESFWYVLESKGVKSNSEKWNRLYNKRNLITFLSASSDMIDWVDQDKNVETQITAWVDKNLPKFNDEFRATLFDFHEVSDYIKRPPAKETSKKVAMMALAGHSQEDIEGMIRARLEYIRTKVLVLETHFVAGESVISGRTQATPLKDEFNLVALDIVLRFPEHKYLFANPRLLDSSNANPLHLKQNYVVGFVFLDQGKPRLALAEGWSEDFEATYRTLDAADCVNEADMQVDNRLVVLAEDVA